MRAKRAAPINERRKQRRARKEPRRNTRDAYSARVLSFPRGGRAGTGASGTRLSAGREREYISKGENVHSCARELARIFYAMRLRIIGGEEETGKGDSYGPVAEGMR